MQRLLSQHPHLCRIKESQHLHHLWITHQYVERATKRWIRLYFPVICNEHQKIFFNESRRFLCWKPRMQFMFDAVVPKSEKNRRIWKGCWQLAHSPTSNIFYKTRIKNTSIGRVGCKMVCSYSAPHSFEKCSWSKCGNTVGGSSGRRIDERNQDVKIHTVNSIWFSQSLFMGSEPLWERDKKTALGQIALYDFCQCLFSRFR